LLTRFIEDRYYGSHHTEYCAYYVRIRLLEYLIRPSIKYNTTSSCMTIILLHWLLKNYFKQISLYLLDIIKRYIILLYTWQKKPIQYRCIVSDIKSFKVYRNYIKCMIKYLRHVMDIYNAISIRLCIKYYFYFIIYNLILYMSKHSEKNNVT
jgi:hypothetical protein